MFACFVTFFPLAALAVVAAAAPNAPEARTTPTCNTGAVHCCNQESIRSQNTSLFTGPYGLVFNAGVQCTAIYIVGVLGNGAQCTQQTPCCNNVNQNGLVRIACSPIAIPL